MKRYQYLIIIAAILVAGVFFWLSVYVTAKQSDPIEERGSHKGRLFRQGEFSLELLIFEANYPPKFHAYASFDNKPIALSDVKLTIELSRLDGEINTITFKPQEDYLMSNEIVQEPHSFDVKIIAIYKGKTYEWTYATYEGRTKFTDDVAKEGGIEVATAKPGIIKQYIHFTLNRNTTTEVRARFPGVVKIVYVKWGDTVKKGDLLATIESNESLKDYDVKSSMDGRILTRNISLGNIAGSEPLFTIANLMDVWAELHVFPRDLGKINEGQSVTIHSEEEDKEVKAPITLLLPTTDPLSQTVIAIVTIANPHAAWRPGTIVRGDVLVAEKKFPLIIKTSALQNYKDWTVVFIKVGDQYEIRPVELGEKDNEWVEVKKGLKAGSTYVITNSFLMKADIEKAGAEHDD